MIPFYSIQGCAYTEELAALAAGHGASDVGGGAALLLPPEGDVQLLVPPAQGCLVHVQPLEATALQPCDEAAAAQRWRWDGASRAVVWAGDDSQCLSWFAERQAWGVWSCGYDAATFEWDALAHTFCDALRPERCLSQLIATVAVQLVAVPADSTHEADASAVAEQYGAAQCLTFRRAFKPLELAPCDTSLDKQLWEYDPTSREMHFSRQRSLCLDWFDKEGRWGVWTCHGAGNEQLMPDASRSGTYCALPAAGRASTPSCVRELVGGSAGGDAPLRLRGAGRAECLEFAAPLQPLRRASCAHTPHQLFKPHPEPSAAGTGVGDAHTYTLQYVRDPQQCLDWFEAEEAWGLWTCDPSTKPNQLLTVTRPEAPASTQAQGDVAAGAAAAGSAVELAVRQWARSRSALRMRPRVGGQVGVSSPTCTRWACCCGLLARRAACASMAQRTRPCLRRLGRSRRCV